MKRSPERDRSGTRAAFIRPLALSFLAVMACFVGSATYSELRSSAILDLSQSLAENAMPSIQHLAAARDELQHIEALALSYAVGTPEERPPLLRQILSAHEQVEREIDSYLRLPVYPHETELWDAIRLDLLDVDEAIASMRVRAESGDPIHLKTSLGEVHDACERAVGAVMRDVEFNAQYGRYLATRIAAIRRRSVRVALLLNTASVVMTIVMALLAVRAVRSHTALLRSQSQLLAQRAEELELFAGRVAHDIRNPLSGATLSLGHVQRHATDPHILAAAARGQSSLRRASQILEGLLAFARAGARPMPGASAEVGEVIEGVLEECRPLAQEARADIHYEPFVPCAVACDPAILMVLLSNLVRNALKYLGDDPRRDVTLRVSDRGASVRIEVIDTGVGVPPELRQSIFEPFVRGPQHGQPGIGLGLATVSRICERHGGRVGLEPQKGGGSCFWAELPKVDGTPIPDTPEASR